MTQDLVTLLPGMRWEYARPDGMTHFSGYGERWLVQLLILDDGQRLGTLTDPSGWNVVHLPDKTLEEVEKWARRYFEAKQPAVEER